MRGPEQRISNFALGAFGFAVCLGLWEYVGVKQLAGLTLPPLSTVLSFTFSPERQGLLQRAVMATVSSVAIGYVIGIVLGCILSMVAHVLSKLRPGLDQLVAMIHVIPRISLAPVLLVFLARNDVGAAISAAGVFTVTYVAVQSGLQSSTQAHRDLMRALGARPLGMLRLIEIPAALPALATAARLAVPVAFIGAIIGEWFGASRGIGVVMISAMQNFQIPLLWSTVLLSAGLSMIFYGLFALLERYVQERLT